MAATSRFGAILQGKCPRCRQGDIFTYPVSKLSKFNVMNARCPHCDVMLQPEPGFYQGAMYVSYAFAVALIVTIGIVLYIAGDPPEWVYITAIIALTILLAPVNYRASRILYLHLFGGIKFDASR
ncbi:MAG: DUF983 domain-containing protein [Cyclobacteriaceae bacterium]|nr:DUF983 domain-containing protein [Cyclobacteriaceae bacterium]